jgi:hypothetical protein
MASNPNPSSNFAQAVAGQIGTYQNSFLNIFGNVTMTIIISGIGILLGLFGTIFGFSNIKKSNTTCRICTLISVIGLVFCILLIPFSPTIPPYTNVPVAVMTSIAGSIVLLECFPPPPSQPTPKEKGS